MSKALMVAFLAACGGSQDTGTNQVTENPPPTGDDGTETPPKDETPKPDKEELPPPPPPKKLTLEERIAFHEGCFQDFLAESPSFIDKCYTDSSSEELVDSGEPQATGKAAITAQTKPFWDAFTLEGASVLTLASGDNTVNIAYMGGVNDGEMMGMKPTGKRFGILMAEVQNLDDQGRHGNVRVYFDMGSMMAQLGGSKAPARKAMTKPTTPGVTVIATDSDAEKANLDLVKGGFELFNKHDAKGLAAKYDAKAVFSEGPMPMDVKGSKAIGAMLTNLWKGFPDAAEQLDGAWAAGDYVVMETTFSGTNKGPLKEMGLKKGTGKAVKARGVHVFHVAGGKITEHWLFANGMAFAMQLGLIQPPPQPKNP
ncbi:MAG TPA: ester cyclase [Kofleriaceae bacterium]|nr:ester cyclase [Kofleriaceae bacterium]